MRISDWSSDVCSSDLEWLNIAAGGQSDAIVEDAAVAAIGRVPGGISRPLRLRKFAVVGGKVAVLVDGGAKGDPLVGGSRLFLYRRQDRIGELREAGHVLDRVAAGDRVVARSEEHTSELQSLMR